MIEFPKSFKGNKKTGEYILVYNNTEISVNRAAPDSNYYHVYFDGEPHDDEPISAKDVDELLKELDKNGEL